MITATDLRSLLAYEATTGLFRWLVDKGGMKAGAVAGTVHHLGYVVVAVNGGKYLAHRLAWLYVHGYLPHTQIDHINGDKSDNRLINLRTATAGQNQRNKGVQRNNTSGQKGVVWSNTTQKWQAQIRVSGKLKYLGQYQEKGDAIEAYRVAAEVHFGAFASHMSRQIASA